MLPLKEDTMDELWRLLDQWKIEEYNEMKEKYWVVDFSDFEEAKNSSLEQLNFTSGTLYTN